ncbi:MAG: restriction endonuclease [Nitrospira sp.]|nr:restriction endonuclease [Nitrospira sp.]
MKFWIGMTDNKWFEFLSARSPDEVNFWRPSGVGSFKAVERFHPKRILLSEPRSR